MHYPYSIDSVLLELLLYKGKVNDFPRHRVLKYEKIISSNCKFFSYRICTAKSKPDRSLNHWAAMAIILLNISRLADIGESMLLSTLESEEDASEDVGD